MALNQREKALLTVPVILGGVMGFYNWVHEPLSLRRSDANVKFEQVQAELIKDQAKLAREGDLTARASAVAAEEKLIDAWVPGKNAAAMFIWYLSQAERHSGVRVHGITVGAKAAPSAEESEPAQTPKPAANGNAQAGAPKASPSGTYDITVIGLDLKVEGRYAEHLLFNQAIEQMPLFLNTDAFTLSRIEVRPEGEPATSTSEDRPPALASALAGSPKVAGTYKVNLYFKTDRPGPATSAMSFTEAAGRSDPFAADSVDAFIQSVLDFYANPGSGGTPAGSGGGPGLDLVPKPGASQMG